MQTEHTLVQKPTQPIEKELGPRLMAAPKKRETPLTHTELLPPPPPRIGNGG